MAVKQSDLLAELRTDLNRCEFGHGAEAHTATVNQMERSLLQQLLRMDESCCRSFWSTGRGRIACATVGLATAEVPLSFAEGRGLLVGLWQTEVSRAYFYAPGYGGKTPLDSGVEFAGALLFGSVDGMC